MIVDASALVAILFNEPESLAFEDALAKTSSPPLMSPINFIEAAVRIDGLKSPEKSNKFDAYVAAAGIQIVDVTKEQTLVAREAYRTYGKGNHPAKLNLGDCFAYALSKARREPLLFKGDDFRQTDVEAAL